MGLVIVVGWIATKGLGNDEDARGLLIGLTAVTVLGACWLLSGHTTSQCDMQVSLLGTGA